jgi:cyclase
MLTRRIIACLEVLDGRVVQKSKFDKVIDVGDPAELSAICSGEGADELVLLDVSTSNEKRPPFFEMVEQVAKRVAIPLSVGGGFLTIDDIVRLLSSGADKVFLNSLLVEDPLLFARAAPRVGPEALVASVKARRQGKGWVVDVKSGTENTELDAIEWAKTVTDCGAGELLVTSVDRDGANNGYDLDLLRELTWRVNVPVIASGGTGGKEEMTDALKIGEADAVLAPSAISLNELWISELKQFIASKGLPVRL